MDGVKFSPATKLKGVAWPTNASRAVAGKSSPNTNQVNQANKSVASSAKNQSPTNPAKTTNTDSFFNCTCCNERVTCDAKNTAVCGNCGVRYPSGKKSAPELDDATLPKFSGYKITRFVGGGGMGTVYAAKQERLANRLVALKTIKADFADRDLAAREILSLVQLQHPGIVTVYDYVSDDAGNDAIVMELVLGPFDTPLSLRQLLRENQKLSAKIAVGLALELLSPLVHAHEKHVIHRDLKPENILVDALGGLRIVDFGIAKVGKVDDTTVQQDSMTMGNFATLGYAPPEVLAGNAKPDPRQDIYAVGAILYEMIMGAVPQGHFELPSEVYPQLPSELDIALQKSLSTKPEKRYANCRAMIADLETVRAKLNALLDSAVNANNAKPVSKDSAKASGESNAFIREANAATMQVAGKSPTQKTKTVKKSPSTMTVSINVDAAKIKSFFRKNPAVLIVGGVVFLLVLWLIFSDDNSKNKKINEKDQRIAELEAESARRRAETEATQRKADAEATRRKVETEAAQRKAEAEAEAARRRDETEAAQRKAEAEAAQRKAETEAAQRKAETEAAQRKAETEAAQRKAETEAAQRKAETEAAQRKAETETAQYKVDTERKATELARNLIVVPNDIRDLAEAVEKVAVGGTIRLKRGTHTVSRAVKINKTIKILGDTDDARDTVITGDITGNVIDTFIVQISGGEATLQGLTITPTGSESSCLLISGGNPRIRGCHFFGSNSVGVHNIGGRAIIENCEIYRNALVGIEVYQGGDPIVRACKIYDNKQNSVLVWDNGKGTFENCEIYRSVLAGFGVGQGGNPKVRKCKIYDGEQSGIYISENGKGTFENCEIYRNDLWGIAVNRGADPTIKNCSIRGKWGIYIFEKGKGTFTNNTLSNSEKNWHIDNAGHFVRTGNKPNQ